jgi:glutamate--cysteine ligase
MDLDPFDAVGIAAPTMRLLDTFLLHCLISDSPPDTPQEIAAIGRNQHRVAARGREPGLKLDGRDGKDTTLAEWGTRIVAECEPIAAALDAAHGGGAAHRDALAHAAALLKDASLTPSARVLHAMARNHDNVYVRFGLVQSLLHAGHVRGLPIPEEVSRRFEELAKDSLAQQRRIESADMLDFETYRRKYLAHDTIIIGQPRIREDR